MTMGMMEKAASPADQLDQSAVAKLLRLVRHDVLAIPEGSLFGIHEDLEQRYDTSRPTLRQVMRVLEHEKLIVVKRGWGGGYYTRRPDQSETIRAAALDLKLRNCTLEHAIEAASGVNGAIAHLAARSADLASRRELAVRLQALEALDFDTITVADFLDRERELNDAMARMAANPALSLFTSVLYELGWTHVDKQIFIDRPDRVAARAHAIAQYMRAVVDGDVPIVDLLSTRAAEMLRQWLEEDRCAASAATS